MKAKAAAHVLCCIACLLITNSKAFAPRPLNFAGEVGDCVQLTRHHHNQDHHHPYSSTSRYKRVHGSLASWPRNSVHEPSTAERDRVGALGSTVRRVRTGRSSRRKSILASAYSEGEPSPGSNETKRPSGPGAGLIDLHFRHIKSGGFKVFLLFFLLGQARAKDNESPFNVRETLDGIRLLIGDDSKNESQWEGVLDLSWGTEPQPFFRVDRIDVNEVVPYPGEVYILNKILDAVIDVNGERSVDDAQKLFLFHPGEQSQLADAKAKLAYLATL